MHTIPKDGRARLYRVCRICDQRREPRAVDECAVCRRDVCKDCSWAAEGGRRICVECEEARREGATPGATA